VLARERRRLARVLATGDPEAVVTGDAVGDDHAPPLPRTFCPKATSPTAATTRVSTSQNQSKATMTESSSAMEVARREGVGTGACRMVGEGYRHPPSLSS
jgi:hypothetical protein